MEHQCTDLATLDNVYELIGIFNDSCQSSIVNLWLMYMDMVEMVYMVKTYIQAKRTGNWLKHIHMVERILPYIFSTTHHIYVSCIPHYLKAMKALPLQREQSLLQLVNLTLDRHATCMHIQQTRNNFTFSWIDKQPGCKTKALLEMI